MTRSAHHAPSDDDSRPAASPAGRFLSQLYRRLQRNDAEAARELADANPELVDAMLRDDGAYAALASALNVAAHQSAGRNQPVGPLTDAMQSVSAAEADRLFHELAPKLVLAVFDLAEARPSFRAVYQGVCHLYRGDVQARLRSSRHVRDALLDELNELLPVLQDAPPTDKAKARAALQRQLEGNGAIDDLYAMTNCIRLLAEAG